MIHFSGLIIFLRRHVRASAGKRYFDLILPTLFINIYLLSCISQHVSNWNNCNKQIWHPFQHFILNAISIITIVFCNFNYIECYFSFFLITLNVTFHSSFNKSACREKTTSFFNISSTDRFSSSWFMIDKYIVFYYDLWMQIKW